MITTPPRVRVNCAIEGYGIYSGQAFALAYPRLSVFSDAECTTPIDIETWAHLQAGPNDFEYPFIEDAAETWYHKDIDGVWSLTWHNEALYMVHVGDMAALGQDKKTALDMSIFKKGGNYHD